MAENINIFSFKDYRVFIEKLLNFRSKNQKGQKSRLAKAINCHPTFISQVLGGKADLSLEQAQSANNYFGHNDLEAYFFLLLLQFNRAGTLELKSILKKQLESLKNQQFNMEKRVDFQQPLNDKEQALYYSHWAYSAIHILVDLPDLDSIESMATNLNLSAKKTADIINDLEKIGLIQKKNHWYKTSKKQIHIGSHSAFIEKHHMNWRLKGLLNSGFENSNNIHYTSAITISEEDSEVVKELIVETIKKIRSIVKKSNSERGFTYCFDFFPIYKKRN